MGDRVRRSCRTEHILTASHSVVAAWTASVLTDRGMCKGLRQVIASHMADGACRVSAYEASSLVMEIPQVLTAVIALASTGVPEAVHVAVMSPAEVAMGRSHWAGSRHEVFRYDSAPG